MIKKKTIQALLIILVTICSCTPGKAQEYSQENENLYSERITLLSDRPMYSVSERLYFSAFYKQPQLIENLSVKRQTREEKMVWDGRRIVRAGGIDNDEGSADNSGSPILFKPAWSTIMYIELITWDGAKMVQSVETIDDGLATGSIILPDNLATGNYYLRAYTKWMRNYSPYTYAYLPVKVINPKSRVMDAGSGTEDISGIAALKDITNTSVTIDLSGISSSYSKRELVEADISIDDVSSKGDFRVTVAKMRPGGFQSVAGKYGEEMDRSPEVIEYLPEVNGLSLSGKVADANSGEPVGGVKVYLSSFASSFYFSAVVSDPEGNFLFTLPHDGEDHEMHITAESGTSGSYQVLVTSEYCNKKVTLPYIPFQLAEDEKVLAGELIRNAQLSAKYSGLFNFPGTKEEALPVFYGSPMSVTYVKDYIELKDLKEFFFELIQKVSIAYDQKQPRLVVSGQSGLGFYPPLVLMDNVPVSNDEVLLNLPSRRIDRIEVVNRGYIIGDFKFSGIVSIFSRNKDMAGLELNSDHHFFNYQLPERSNYQLPDIPAYDSNRPDRRNMLYWNPSICLEPGKNQKISFYTSDAPGNYIIDIQGVNERTGEVISGQKLFTVE